VAAELGIGEKIVGGETGLMHLGLHGNHLRLIWENEMKKGGGVKNKKKKNLTKGGKFSKPLAFQNIVRVKQPGAKSNIQARGGQWIM